MSTPSKPFGKFWPAIVALLQMVACVTSQAALSDGLVAYWNFDGNLNDSIKNFHGTGRGTAPIPFVDGKTGFGKAIKLNGDDQFVEITGGNENELEFAGGSMSISGWFTVDTFDTSWQCLISKGEGTNYRVARRGTGNTIAYAGGVGEPGAAAPPVDDGLWHHFVAVSDKDFGTILYVDGVEAEVNQTPPVLATSALPLMIGENPGARSREWEGQLDDFAIWNRVLTPAEVTQLWAAGAGKTITSFLPVKIEILGTGAGSLIGSDLTDPENDGDEAAGPTSPTWDWAGITSSHEPGFGGGEFSFNIFDNLVGGGNDKWCCDDPTPGNPVWVAVQFKNPVSLTHFTVTSGNDTPTRDPTDWAIQGSADGATYTDIYHFKGTPVPWTERNQVVKFTLPAPAAAYRYIRYIAFDTPATLHQINEVEYFGNIGGSQAAFLSGILNGINTFGFTVNDAGAAVVDPATVRLTLDGANINLGTLTKANGAIVVTHRPAGPFLPGSVHSYAIAARDNFGNNITSSGTFTTAIYALLRAGDRVTANTTRPGFLWNVHQNGAFQANDNVRPVRQLAGLLGPNEADPAAQGVAIAAGTAGASANLPVKFEIDTVINMSQTGGEANGAFPDDGQMPGIPGINGIADGIAGEILTYLELPAGLTTMVVNSDDGFRTTAGLIDDLFKAQVAGAFSGGRGAADTMFTLYAETAGVYPFRTVWEEGGGGANIEWLTLKADGTKVLINDVANGGIKAYRATSGGQPPTSVISVSPAIGTAEASATDPIKVVIQEGGSPVDLASVRMTLDGIVVTPTVTKSGSLVTVLYQPTAPFALQSSHFAAIMFTAGSARTDSWNFSVPKLTKDLVKGYPANFLGSANYSTNNHTGKAGDYSIDLTRQGGPMHVVDASFLNTATATDELTFALWIKKYDIADSSAFWAVSPSSNNGERGFQAHTPWSNNNIYFDTSGCCDGGTQRINAPINTFADYADDSFWTNAWHHFTFSKKADAKQIWIDGKLFLEGSNTAPLPTDFTGLYMGGDNSGVGNLMHGWIDDFAIYGTALSQPDIGKLVSGTAPNALGNAVKLMAFWDFNDPSAPPPPARTYSIGLNFGSDEFPTAANTGSLATNVMAGLSPVAQRYWNNLPLLSGTNSTTIVADAAGVSKKVTTSVIWSSANTWSTTGRGEENNPFANAGDKGLMTGYLDTGAATTSSVTISNIPPELTSNGYDVIVYAMGGVGGRGGGYRVLDAVTKNVLAPYIRIVGPTNSIGFLPVTGTPGATNINVGNVVRLSGLNASSIIVEATTAGGQGIGGTPRAPINAVQLTAPGSAVPAPKLSLARSGANITITFTGTLQSADRIIGPWTNVPGATSPLSVTPGGSAKFYRASN